MNLKTQKKMASDILGVGENKVWIDPGRQEEVEGAITREDIRNLIEAGTIQKKKDEGNSRGRAREKHEQAKRGRGKGHGQKKGSKDSRKDSKEEWQEKIRALRKRLKEMRDEGELDSSSYRKMYDMAKGGFFRSKKHMEIYIDKNVKN